MHVTGVIAEFNPLHTGHQYLLDTIRKQGADAIVCVMSGNYVQRGEAAILDKWHRTLMALAAGADLVIDLPTPWAVSSSDYFAMGAVSLLHHLGIVDTLCFGSELGDADALIQTSNILESKDFQPFLQEALSLGVSFPKAQQMAYEKMTATSAQGILDSPNNILALAYIKALNTLNSSIKPMSIKRKAVQHNDMHTEKGFASATYIRALMQEEVSVQQLLPEHSYQIYKAAHQAGVAPFCNDKMAISMLSYFRRMDEQDWQKAPDVTEGLENRLITSLQNSTTIDEFLQIVKSKRFTMSRLRRVLLRAFLNIPKDIYADMPPYLRVLGFSPKGKMLLTQARAKAELPIITKYADVNTLSVRGKQLFDIESKATDLYNSFLPKIQPMGQEMRQSVIVWGKEESYPKHLQNIKS